MSITPTLKKYVLPNLTYALIFGLAISWVQPTAPHWVGLSSKKLVNSMNTLNKAMSNPLPSFHPNDLLVGIAGVFISGSRGCGEFLCDGFFGGGGCLCSGRTRARAAYTYVIYCVISANLHKCPVMFKLQFLSHLR